jgi:hypothetical protein
MLEIEAGNASRKWKQEVEARSRKWKQGVEAGSRSRKCRRSRK